MSDQDPVVTFIDEVRAAGVATVVLAWQDEWDVTDQGGFGPVLRGRLLAYAAGSLITADVRGEDARRDALADRLRTAGLQVELRTRNRSG